MGVEGGAEGFGRGEDLEGHGPRRLEARAGAAEFAAALPGEVPEIGGPRLRPEAGQVEQAAVVRPVRGVAPATRRQEFRQGAVGRSVRQEETRRQAEGARRGEQPRQGGLRGGAVEERRPERGVAVGPAHEQRQRHAPAAARRPERPGGKEPGPGRLGGPVGDEEEPDARPEGVAGRQGVARLVERVAHQARPTQGPPGRDPGRRPVEGPDRRHEPAGKRGRVRWGVRRGACHRGTVRPRDGDGSRRRSRARRSATPSLRRRR